MRLYQYVGPIEIARQSVSSLEGFTVDSQASAMDSLCLLGGYRSGESLTVTFIVARDGQLKIADRRSEHVACAAGQAVLSAGEMTFGFGYRGSRIAVERVTNQSTGYCPEPESWISVAAVLDCLLLPRPDHFDPAFVFRRCPPVARSTSSKTRGSNAVFAARACRSIGTLTMEISEPE